MPTGSLDRFIRFDRNSGILRCEAGITLETILRLCVPEGWFLPKKTSSQAALNAIDFSKLSDILL